MHESFKVWFKGLQLTTSSSFDHFAEVELCLLVTHHVSWQMGESQVTMQGFPNPKLVPHPALYLCNIIILFRVICRPEVHSTFSLPVWFHSLCTCWLSDVRGRNLRLSLFYASWYLVSALMSIWSHDRHFCLAHTDTRHFEWMDQEYLFNIPVQCCWTSGRCSDISNSPGMLTTSGNTCVGLRDSFWGSLTV